MCLFILFIVKEEEGKKKRIQQNDRRVRERFFNFFPSSCKSYLKMVQGHYAFQGVLLGYCCINNVVEGNHVRKVVKPMEARIKAEMKDEMKKMKDEMKEKMDRILTLLEKR